MATVLWKAGENFTINNLAGSGIGFYGASFGTSVAVGSYQTKTFITDSTGTDEGPQCDNCQYLNISGVISNGGSGIHLLQLPNYLSSFEIEFTHNSAVITQNALLYTGDRTSKNNSPGDLNVRVAEIIHPPTTQSFTGSGSAIWYNNAASGLPLTDSPGLSGLSPNGPATSSTSHSWYIAMSCSPTSTGSKEFAAWFQLEYL